MKIFKDLFTGDELFSDSFPIELVDDIIYKVKGKVRTDTFDIDSSAIGGNASAEGGEGDEGAEATSKQGVDIIMNSRLVEYGLNKKDYVTHIKGYMAEVLKYLNENKPAEAPKFKENVEKFVKKVVGEFKEYQFFCGESMKPDGMLALMRWEDNDDGKSQTPYMYFFKHGLKEEKV